jgi:dockerin type I repeat protein
MKLLGVAMVAAVLLGMAAWAGPEARPAAQKAEASSSLQIILQLDSALVGVSETGTQVPIYLANILQPVGGFEISLLLDRPDLFKFASATKIETTIVCIDPIDCNPADTTIDTVANSQLNLTGGAIANWEFVQARALSNINLKIAALADAAGGPSTPPLPPSSTPILLCKVSLTKVASGSLLDTLYDRNTKILIDQPSCSFSTPTGVTIGRTDSIHCINPPSCTQKDTIYYTDQSVFVYVNGARAFGPACLKGDVNKSGTINSADIIYLVNFVFKAGAAPLCSPSQGDVNCNGVTNSADIIYLVNFVFKGGPGPGSC